VTGIAAFRPARAATGLAPLLCLGWTLFDLLWFATGYNPTITKDPYYPSTPAIEFLRRDSSSSRILGAGTVLAPNTAATYGLYDLRGTDFVTVRRYEELITGKAGDFAFYSRSPELPPSFGMLNARYLLLPGPVAHDPNLLEPVYSDEITIYRYRNCLERALVVFDHEVHPDPHHILERVRKPDFDARKVLLLEEGPEPAFEPAATRTVSRDSAARITRYEPDEVVVEASLSRPGFLLLLDTFFPGWQATVNGRNARIYRADYTFRAIALPRGQSTVRFEYRPASLRIGLALAAAAGTLLIGGLALTTMRGRRPSRPPS
jgi:hypothetical protein